MKEVKVNGRTLAVVAAAICFVIGLMAAALYQRDVPVKPNNGELNAKMSKISEISDEDKQAAINQLVEEGTINVTYASKATFDLHGKSTLFCVRNIENNHYPVVFEIFDDHGDSIFMSDPMEPGYEVTEITLAEALPEGVYDFKISVGYENNGNVRSTFPLQVTVKDGDV